MRIIAVRVGKEPTVEELENELLVMQEFVGGYIQPVYAFDDDAIVVCNEDGKLMPGIAPNRIFHTRYLDDVIVGDFFICRDGEEDFESLTDEQIDLYMAMLNGDRRYGTVVMC